MLKEIDKELKNMLEEEISYIEDIWKYIDKIKDNLTKDEIIDISNLYINMLKELIKKEKENN